MTREQNIAKIREACIKENPERWNNPDNYEPNRMGWDIRLADVLLAIDKALQAKESPQAKERELLLRIGTDGGFHQQHDIGYWRFEGCYWNLSHDSLTDQSDETISFIASVV